MSYELPLTDALTHVGRPDLAKTAAGRAEGYTFESRDATIMSFVQALTKNASAETVDACRQHGRFWGIAPQLVAVEQKLASYQPEDVADQQFALVAQFGGQPVRKYAAYDRDSVSTAASAFYDDRSCYPLSWRKFAAARLIGRAERYATVLPDYIETYLYKAACLGYPTVETLEDAYVQRANALNGDGATELAKFGELVAVMSSRKDLRHDAEFVKAAIDVLADLDTQFGLTDKYASGELRLPEDVLADELTLPTLQKRAAAMCTLSNGQDVNITKIGADVLNAIDPALTKLSAHELAEVLPTLPKGDADLLMRLHKSAAEGDTTSPVDAPVEDTLNDDQGEMAPTDMAAGPISTDSSAEMTSSMPTAESTSAPMDMPTTPPAAGPTTGTPSIEPAGMTPASAPMDMPQAAPATAPIDPNAFTDETSGTLTAGPQVNRQTAAAPVQPPVAPAIAAAQTPVV